jgi:hypothetical protein
MEIAQDGRAIKIENLARKYGNGKGIGYVISNRIYWMKKMGLLRKTGTMLEVGFLGKVLNQSRKIFLTLWRLRQLGQ